MKIYTRTGDGGTTSLFSGLRVPKHDLRVEAYGTVDELAAHLGLVTATTDSAPIRVHVTILQNELFVLGSDLATPLDPPPIRTVPRITPAEVVRLESAIDALTADLPSLTQFILPGGSPPAAHLHVARTVCRRAERLVLSLSERENITPAIIPYLNRLSDFLFTLSRFQNHLLGVPEPTWTAPSTP